MTVLGRTLAVRTQSSVSSTATSAGQKRDQEIQTALRHSAAEREKEAQRHADDSGHLHGELPGVRKPDTPSHDAVVREREPAPYEVTYSTLRHLQMNEEESQPEEQQAMWSHDDARNEVVQEYPTPDGRPLTPREVRIDC
jgi:hypothetical protein